MLWKPTEKQWWITGFNPSTVGKADVIKIGCNFKNKSDILIYDYIHDKYENNSQLQSKNANSYSIYRNYQNESMKFPIIRGENLE